jgi:outer membrane receptor protein involved in Fe transport
MARHSRSQGIARTTLTRGLPLASTLLAAVSTALAQQAPPASDGLEEIIVTAQKRSEDLQKVPMSIQALSTQKLEENHVSSFQDYAKLLPSVSFQDGAAGGGSGGPGFARVYMRGVSSGGDGNHSGPQPSVGMYLDEQPVTTIQGSLDIHIYDVQRVEALAGPQGTLYGASSEAGTIRIITNKPELGVVKGGYDVQGNFVQNGTFGYVAEGFTNLPLGDTAAIRLVGWTQHDSGYIDNVHQTFRYSDGGDWLPDGSFVSNHNGFLIDNAAVAKKHYNDSSKTGARAALRIDLNDRWTITPSVITQYQKTNGFPGTDATLGDLKVAHYKPESTMDSWVQSALTVEGKIGNFDIVYAGAFLKRQDETHSDYTDYSIGYDNLYGSAAYFTDNNGALIDGSQYIAGKDHYQKYSNELRVSSPKDLPFRFVGGLFQQRQAHEIEQNYLVPGLASAYNVTGWPNTWWLTEQERVDRDTAVFAELSYDITSKLTATVGARYFESRNSLQGFFGVSANNPVGGLQRGYGEQLCVTQVHFHGAPCEKLPAGTTSKDSGSTPKFNLTYRFDDQHLLYATWSKGFRPGGANRYDANAPYKPDYLTNIELGWKTSYMDNHLRFNGAVFSEDWKDFQFAYLGSNGFTIINNVGQARINGIETSVEFAASQGLSVSAAVAYYDAKLKQDYCKDPTDCANTLQAPSGTQLPVTPKFKGNVTSRYKFSAGGHDAFVQGTVIYQGDSYADLRPAVNDLLGKVPAFTTVDASTGIQLGRGNLELFITNLLDDRGQLSHYTECAPGTCTTVYAQPTQPRTIGLKWGQKF